MRISWGYKIFIAYTVFALGILFLAYKANKENFDLVTENYYDAELKYQDVINEKSNVAQLSAPPKISHTINSISLQLPNEFTNKVVQGEIYLYRPSDATKDIRKSFSTSDAFYQLNLAENLSGAYIIKLSWQSEGKSFYQEQKIFF